MDINIKKKIITEIVKQLVSQLETMTQAAKISSQAASHPDNKAENRQDTRATLDGYLASAQSKLAENIEKQIASLNRLPVRNFSAKDQIAAGALIGLRAENMQQKFYFLLPDCGGLVLTIDEKTIHVISTRSPLGGILLGELLGETIVVETPQGLQEYEISFVL